MFILIPSFLSNLYLVSISLNIEGVQRPATKFILKTKDSYETHLERLNLLSLENRRVLTDVTFFT